MSKTRIAGDTLSALGAGIAEEAGQIKEKVIDVFDVGLNSAKATVERASKLGCSMTEDLLDDAAHQVKRRPLQSVVLTLGIGLLTGLTIGWLAARKGNQFIRCKLCVIASKAVYLGRA